MQGSWHFVRERTAILSRATEAAVVQDYDQRTVTVPREIFSKLSGADLGRLKTCSHVLGKETAGKHRSHAAASQQQYWSIKQRYRDVLLFFKVGKLPELLRMMPRCPSLLKRH